VLSTGSHQLVRDHTLLDIADRIVHMEDGHLARNANLATNLG
jgi:hypothetical protein